MGLHCRYSDCRQYTEGSLGKDEYTSRACQVYSEVQARAREVRELSASIQEVHDMFRDLHFLLAVDHEEVVEAEEKVCCEGQLPPPTPTAAQLFGSLVNNCLKCPAL